MDRSSPVPLHHQLKLILAEAIRRGELGAGDALPGELRLCEQYDVSRTVVRQTLAQLEFEGLVERIRGRGTFVSAARPPQGHVQSLSGQFEDLAASGLHLRSDVRRLEPEPAPAPIADLMRVPAGAVLTRLERVRYVGDEAWVVVGTYLPAETLPWLRSADLGEGSLYDAMESHEMRPINGRRTVQAVSAGVAVSRALSIRRGAAVLRLTSIGYDRRGRPVEYYEAFHRGDRTSFKIDLDRTGTAEDRPSVLIGLAAS